MLISTWKYLLCPAGGLALVACGCAGIYVPAANAMQAANVAEPADDVAATGTESAATAADEIVVAQADPPVTEAPLEYAAGTTWTADVTRGDGPARRVTHTIVERREYRGREVYVSEHSEAFDTPGSACHGETGSLVDVATDNWIGCLKEGEILARHAPHNARYSWPMYVGKSWALGNAWIDNTANTRGSFTLEREVVAWEEVTVPAGTFMAYRIERKDWPETVWFAPESMNLVKIVSGGGDSGFPVFMWELVARDLK